MPQHLGLSAWQRAKQVTIATVSHEYRQMRLPSPYANAWEGTHAIALSLSLGDRMCCSIGIV